MDLQLVSQCGSTYNCLSGSAPEIHSHVSGTSSNKQSINPKPFTEGAGWLLACLTSQQQASVSQGRICSGNFTCCHTEIEVADQTFHLTQSQYTDTGPTSPSADPITPGAWQGSHWSAYFEVTGTTRPRKKSRRKRDSNRTEGGDELGVPAQHHRASENVTY